MPVDCKTESRGYETAMQKVGLDKLSSYIFIITLLQQTLEWGVNILCKLQTFFSL